MTLKEDTIKKIGKKVGYIFGYFVFTTALFFILRISNKMPQTWSYLHIMFITVIITLIGVALGKLLK